VWVTLTHTHIDTHTHTDSDTDTDTVTDRHPHTPTHAHTATHMQKRGMGVDYRPRALHVIAGARDGEGTGAEGDAVELHA